MTSFQTAENLRIRGLADVDNAAAGEDDEAAAVSSEPPRFKSKLNSSSRLSPSSSKIGRTTPNNNVAAAAEPKATFNSKVCPRFGEFSLAVACPASFSQPVEFTFFADPCMTGLKSMSYEAFSSTEFQGSSRATHGAVDVVIAPAPADLRARLPFALCPSIRRVGHGQAEARTA